DARRRCDAFIGPGPPLRGGDDPRAHFRGTPALPATVLPPGVPARRGAFRGVDRRHRARRARRLLAPVLLVQARRVLARPLVAVRALGERSAVAARDR